MSKKINHIDQIARQKLFDAKVDPPIASWDRLRKDMDKNHKRKRILLFTKLAAAAGVLLLISLGIFYIDPINVNKTIGKTPTLSDSTKTQIQKIKSIALNSPIEIIPKNELTLNTNQVKIKKTAETNFKDQIEIACMKLIDFIYPIEIYSPKPRLIAQNNLMENDATHFNWSDYEYKELSDPEARNGKNWKLGLGISPSYASVNSPSNNNLDYVYVGLDAPSGTNETNASEEFLPSLTLGANFSYDLSDKWSVISGLYYSKQKNEVQNFYIIEDNFNSENNLSSNSSIGNIKINNRELISQKAEFSNQIELSAFSNISNYNSDLIQQFEFIEVPLLISYKLISKKWTVSLITGVNAGFLVGNNVYMKNFESGNDKLGSTEDINSLSLKSVLGFSFEYPLSKRLYLSIAPTYKYQINNFNKVLMNNYHLKFLDFKTGISYHF